MNRCGCTNNIEGPIHRFWIVDPAGRKLGGQVLGGGYRETSREGIGFSAIDIPAVLIRFTAMKRRCFHLYRTVCQPKSDHVRRNMRRILLMMAQRRERVF